MEDDAFDPAQELAEIAASLRAHLEWQADLGAVGVPRDLEARKRVAQQLAQQRSATPQVGPTPAASAESRARPGSSPASTVSSPSPTGSSSGPTRSSPDLSGSSPARVPDAPPASSQSREVTPPSPPSFSAKEASAAVRVEAVSLEVLENQVKGCVRCALHEQRTQTVFSRGSGTSGLCFVGEGPGADEDAQGQPFVGKAGQLLDKMIAAMGFDREEVYVCNIVKCRPPSNRKPVPAEMAACAPYLERQLELLNPQVIVALGATAVEGLVGKTGGITRLRGQFCLYRGRIAVMPTFHPAYLLRNPAAKRDVWSDLRQVLHHMGREAPG